LILVDSFGEKEYGTNTSNHTTAYGLINRSLEGKRSKPDILLQREEHCLPEIPWWQTTFFRLSVITIFCDA